jgi:hypothetical protein
VSIPTLLVLISIDLNQQLNAFAWQIMMFLGKCYPLGGYDCLQEVQLLYRVSHQRSWLYLCVTLKKTTLIIIGRVKIKVLELKKFTRRNCTHYYILKSVY